MPIIQLAPASVALDNESAQIQELLNTENLLQEDAKFLLTTRHGSQNVITQGANQGKSIGQWLAESNNEVLGTRGMDYGTIPFEIRDLGAENAKIFYSARKQHSANWFVTSAPEGAAIYFGFNNQLTPDELQAALKDGSWKDKLTKVETKAGDLFDLEPGTIYVFEKGPRILEVQKTVDEKDPNEAVPFEKVQPVHDEHDHEHEDEAVAEGEAETACAGYNDVYVFDLYRVDGSLDLNASSRSFKVLVFLNGDGVVNAQNETYHVEPDSVLFVGADTPTFNVTGNCSFAMIHLS